MLLTVALLLPQDFKDAGMGVEFILPNGICGGLPLTSLDYKYAQRIGFSGR